MAFEQKRRRIVTQKWQPHSNFGVSESDGKISKVGNLDSDTKVIRACGKPVVKLINDSVKKLFYQEEKMVVNTGTQETAGPVPVAKDIHFVNEEQLLIKRAEMWRPQLSVRAILW